MSTQSELLERLQAARAAYVAASHAENQEDFLNNQEADLWHANCIADNAYGDYLEHCPNKELEDAWLAGAVARVFIPAHK